MTPVLIRELSGGCVMERDTAGAADNVLRAKVWDKVFLNGLLPGGGGGPSCLVDYTSVMGKPGRQFCVFLSLEPRYKTRENEISHGSQARHWPQGREGKGSRWTDHKAEKQQEQNWRPGSWEGQL